MIESLVCTFFSASNESYKLQISIYFSKRETEEILKQEYRRGNITRKFDQSGSNFFLSELERKGGRLRKKRKKRKEKERKKEKK